MISKKQLEQAEREHWQHLEDAVIQWAKVNVPEQYNYSSKASYWRSAVTAGIITEDDLKLAYHMYGHMIDYTGD